MKGTARVGDEAGGRARRRPGRTAGLGLLLQHDDAPAGVGEQVRGDQPVRVGSDDHRVRGVTGQPAHSRLLPEQVRGTLARMAFRDRADAGRQLAERLSGVDLASPVVLGMPRGGVPVAAEVADVLDAPLDVLVARKIGAPGQEELGVGAVAEGLDEPVISAVAYRIGLTAEDVRQLAVRTQQEVDRRVLTYRGGRPALPVGGMDVLLVDDGSATGVTAEAA